MNVDILLIQLPSRWVRRHCHRKPHFRALRSAQIHGEHEAGRGRPGSLSYFSKGVGETSSMEGVGFSWQPAPQAPG